MTQPAKRGRVVLTEEEASAIYGDADSVFGGDDSHDMGHGFALSSTMEHLLGRASGAALFDDWCRRRTKQGMVGLAEFLGSRIARPVQPGRGVGE